MPPKVEHTVMKVADLKPAPYNPRRIEPAAMAGLTNSYQRFGLVQSIIVNRRTGYVVGGHQRLKVLRAANEKEAHVTVVDLDDTEEKALNIALNSGAISGEFTDDLQGLLADLESADGQMFADLRLGELLTDAQPKKDFGESADDVPEVPTTVPITKPGDIWTLGRHRLICGDCTNQATIKTLLGGELVDCLVTDPPYGLDLRINPINPLTNPLKPSSVNERAIENDVAIDYRKFFAAFLRVIPWAHYASYYVFMSTLELHNMRLAIDDVGMKFSDYLVWVKHQMVPSIRKDYSSKCELIVYGWPRTHRFYGPSNAITVLEFDRPGHSKLHPTMKPAALLQRLLEDGSTDGSIILDSFGGSGSTLIACEASKRNARLCELNGHYCDVAAQRWSTITGDVPLLNGERTVIVPAVG